MVDLYLPDRPVIELPLGGKAPIKDPRTFQMRAAVLPGYTAPSEIDLEASVGYPPPPKPMRSTGKLANEYAGSCTFNAADGLITRFQKREHRTATWERMDPDTLVGEYLKANGNDLLGGWYALEVVKQWRKFGLPTTKARRYITWFGEVNPQSDIDLRTGLDVFGGLYLVFGLPAHWSEQFARYNPNAPEVLTTGSRIASWGWHAVFTNAASVSAGGVWVSFESWGYGRMLVTWDAMQAYCTEAYALADAFDHIRRPSMVNLGAVKDQFESVDLEFKEDA